MRITRWIVAAALGICAAGAAAHDYQSGKRSALAFGAPWQAEIYSNFKDYTAEERAQKELWELAHRCGGSLIAPQWVLTAARHYHDIALVHFVADGETDASQPARIKPIRLNGTNAYDAPIGAGVAVSATGWGKTAPGADGRATFGCPRPASLSKINEPELVTA